VRIVRRACNTFRDRFHTDRLAANETRSPYLIRPTSWAPDVQVPARGDAIIPGTGRGVQSFTERGGDCDSIAAIESLRPFTMCSAAVVERGP
jgi:hypothetical protein